VGSEMCIRDSAQGYLYLSMRCFAVVRAGEAGERHPWINELRRPHRRINIQPYLNVLSVIKSLML